jgi:hypothetical protein
VRAYIAAFLALTSVPVWALDPASEMPWAVLETAHAGWVDQAPIDSARSTVVTPSGHIYLVSAYPSGPVTAQYGDAAQSGLFVTKFDNTGLAIFSVRVAGTYLVRAVAVDTAENVYFSGEASSSGLPVTAASYLTAPAGIRGGYTCEIKADGEVAFCTYLPAIQLRINSMAVDRAGNVYVAGSKSGDTSVSTTPGAVAQPGAALFVLKLANSGSQLAYSASFFTTGYDGYAGDPLMAVDASGNAYIVDHGCGDLQVMSNPLLTYCQPASFLTVLRADGTSFIYTATISPDELFDLIALDGAANVYLTGNGPGGASFVRKYVGYGPTVAYQTNMTPWPSNGLTPVAIALDDSGAASIAISTAALNVPIYRPTLSCPSVTKASSNDAVLMRFSASGDLLQSTYLPDSAYPMALAATETSAHIAALVYDHPYSMIGVTFGPEPPGTPDLHLTCIGNGATFQLGGISAGEVVTLFGSGLGPQRGVPWQWDENLRLMATLAETQVTLDGTPAPLLYTQDAQINAITPWGIAGKSSTQVCTFFRGAQTNCITAAVLAATPAVFTTDAGTALAINQDGTVNSWDHPALRGSIISIYSDRHGVRHTRTA